MKLVLPGKIQSGYFYAKFQGSCFDHNENISFFFQQLPTWINMLKKKIKRERDSHFLHNHHRRCSPMVFRLKKKKCYWTILNFERYPQSKTEQKKLKRILQCCRFYEYANQQDTSQVYQIVRIINISMVFHQN